MSWKAYNEVIAALREAEDLSLPEARARYEELRDELGHPPTIEDVDEQEDHEERQGLYSNLDDWLEAYADGEFDDYDVDEIDGGVDTGEAGSK